MGNESTSPGVSWSLIFGQTFKMYGKWYTFFMLPASLALVLLKIGGVIDHSMFQCLLPMLALPMLAGLMLAIMLSVLALAVAFFLTGKLFFPDAVREFQRANKYAKGLAEGAVKKDRKKRTEYDVVEILRKRREEQGKKKP